MGAEVAQCADPQPSKNIALQEPRRALPPKGLAECKAKPEDATEAMVTTSRSGPGKYA